MIYLINLYAKYNLDCNNQMIKLLEDHINDPWNYQLNGYYFKTIGNILEHVYKTDNNWMLYILKCTQKILKNNYNILQIIDNETKYFNTINDYKSERKILDQKIIYLSEELQDKNISISTKEINNGKTIQLKPIIHMFNHQTHHRGQISNLLDNLNIENNYSNIINM